ncbi:MAG: peptidoglycan DD-metalloendopeptidase family protein [Flavobacteriales bacterium]
MGETRSFWNDMRRFGLGLLAVVFIGTFYQCGNLNPETRSPAIQGAPEPQAPKERFGIIWSDFLVDSGEVKSGQSLSHLLSPAGLSAGAIANIAESSKPTYDVRSMRAGQPWWMAYREDSSQTPAFFIYQRNPMDYAVFPLDSPYGVKLGTLPTDTVIERAKGVIQEALYLDLERSGAPTSLALSMASVYAWTVDFSRLQKGDAFDIIYERTYVAGKPTGMPRVIVCHFEHRGQSLPAYRFDQGEGLDYFDSEGQSLRKAFLKAPVEFSRISSRYNMKRFHPVLNKMKAHYGTDYAAPSGTPIIAVGDGVVTKSAYTSGNGKYVKIRHNETYETQYLHMSRRAVHVGERVRQGQIIGYVGSTGLATGPHVCFRFWKNGKQVDHLREAFPPSTPIKDDHIADFEETMTRLRLAIEEGGEVR